MNGWMDGWMEDLTIASSEENQSEIKAFCLVEIVMEIR